MIFHWQIMDEDDFWAILGEVAVRGGGDSERNLAVLERVLRGLPPRRIRGFAQRMSIVADERYSWKQWGAACLFSGRLEMVPMKVLAANLILRGRSAFEGFLREPSSIAEVFAEHEDALDRRAWRLAGDLYDEVTGRGDPELPPRRYVGLRGHPVPDRTLPGLFPEIWARGVLDRNPEDFRPDDGIADLWARRRRQRLQLRSRFHDDDRRAMTARLRDILSEGVGEPREELHAAAALEDLWGLDGLGSILWVCEIEESFEFDPKGTVRDQKMEKRWERALERAWSGRGIGKPEEAYFDDFVDVVLTLVEQCRG